MSDFVRKINAALEEGKKSILKASDLPSLESAKAAVFGRNGTITLLSKELAILPREEKPSAGKALNDAKKIITTLLNEQYNKITEKIAIEIINSINVNPLLFLWLMIGHLC